MDRIDGEFFEERRLECGWGRKVSEEVKVETDGLFRPSWAGVR